MHQTSADPAAALARAELPTTLELTLADASDVHRSVRAIVEILQGCGPEKQITAMLFLGLLEPIRVQMDNVIDGVRLMCQAEGVTL